MRPHDDEVRRMRRRRARRILLGLVALVYVVSVPWYRATGTPPVIVLGLPDWVTVALACYLAAAVMNAGAWLLADIRDRVPPADEQ